jgi:serine/threonine-protein kinase
VKPENIFLAQDRDLITPKLLDFGISKEVRAEGSAGSLNTVTGTPQYMAPEQARGAAVDGRTDEYALAVVLYQSLTGRPPYDSGSLFELVHMIDAGDCPPIRALRPEIPSELESVVLRAMAVEPDDRFPSVAAFGLALLPFASEGVQATLQRELSNQTRPQRSESSTHAAPRTPPAVEPAQKVASAQEPSIVAPATSVGAEEPRRATRKTAGASRTLWLLAAFLTAALIASVTLYQSSSSRPPTDRPSSSTPMKPARAPEPSRHDEHVAPSVAPDLTPVAPPHNTDITGTARPEHKTRPTRDAGESPPKWRKKGTLDIQMAR